MLKTFCTELLSHPSGHRWAGPEILAMDWDEAEKKAAMCNAKVTGELVAKIAADSSWEWWHPNHREGV